MASSFDCGQAAPGISSRDHGFRPRADPVGRSAGPSPFVSLGCDQHMLCRLIEGEIIPRLVAAGHAGELDVAPAAFESIDVDALVALALQVEADELLDVAERLLARGLSVADLLVDVLAPAARRLGEYWVEDRCDFVDVTMGLWRLQEVVHEVGGRGHLAAPDGGRRALFAVMPGEQHSFGTVLVDEVFTRDGWLTERMAETEARTLCDRVAHDWFDLVGLTVSCDRHLADVPSLIGALRSVSRNPRVRIMVGGRVFGGDLALAERVGADGTAGDARQALVAAAALVDMAACSAAHSG